MKRSLIAPIIVMILVSLACSLNVNLPEMEVGDILVLNLDQPLTNNSDVVSIDLSMGAGTLSLSGGAPGLINGSIEYNVADWEPAISQRSDSFSIKQVRALSISGIPTDKIVNDWDLMLSSQVPLELNIEAGAYKGNLDLSGLRLRKLDILEGASETTVNFDVPNPEVINNFKFQTGASFVKLYGLANANFKSMDFVSGAGSYVFSFDGTLQQDAEVNIKSAASNLEILIPSGMKVVIVNQGKVINVNTKGTWTIKDNTYSTPGDGFTLTITINMAVGNIVLSHAE